MLREFPRRNSRISFLRPFASLLLVGLGFAGVAAAQSVPFPTYQAGPQTCRTWPRSRFQITRNSIWASPISTGSMSGSRTSPKTWRPVRCPNWNSCGS
jgi:hypothetical protein